MDEWERTRKAQAHPVSRPEERRRNIEDTDNKGKNKGNINSIRKDGFKGNYDHSMGSEAK